MWKGGPKAFTVDLGDVFVDYLSEDVWGEMVDGDDDEFTVNVDSGTVKIQVNLSSDGSWVIVGVNGHPIDTTKRLVNV